MIINILKVLKQQKNNMAINKAKMKCNSPKRQVQGGKKFVVKIKNAVPWSGKLLDKDGNLIEKSFSLVEWSHIREKVKYLGEYKDGKPNGLLVYWYENGNKMREGKLQGGTPVGIWYTYKEDGSVQATIDH